jgi:N-acetyl sugar amidotransferase
MASSSPKYQECSRCVMDTSDPEIQFDESGVCNHCSEFALVTSKGWFPNAEGASLLQKQVERIKQDAAGKPYDCILGLSGGVDSSYLAIKVKELGLRPLVMHVDAGWNSELAVSNIEKVVKYCGFDLHTHVINWEEMRDLQLAYLKAGISNQDVPQDHAFFASMYHFAVENGIRTIISGGNLATEGVFPKSWHGSAMDAKNLKAIHRQFGSRPLKGYKTISFFQYYFLYPFVYKMRTLRPLNFMTFNKDEAISYLEREVGWRAYGRKHGESVFTKFFQNYYLPQKFGFDKRRPHFSSLVVSGQMSRDEAVQALNEPLYDPRELEDDISYFCKKLRIQRDEFNKLLAQPSRHYSEFDNWDRLHALVKRAQSLLGMVLGRKIRVYS